MNGKDYKPWSDCSIRIVFFELSPSEFLNGLVDMNFIKS